MVTKNICIKLQTLQPVVSSDIFQPDKQICNASLDTAGVAKYEHTGLMSTCAEKIEAVLGGCGWAE